MMRLMDALEDRREEIRNELLLRRTQRGLAVAHQALLLRGQDLRLFSVLLNPVSRNRWQRPHISQHSVTQLPQSRRQQNASGPPSPLGR